MATLNFNASPPNVQAAPVVASPAEPTPGSIFALVVDRLATGSPFQTLPGAFAGYEEIARLGDWRIGLSFYNKVLSLKATSRQACRQLPQLPIATRIGKGQYNILIDRAGFDRWIAPIAPKPAPVVEQPQFDLIIATRKVAKFAGHTQSNDGKITWWKQAGQDRVNPKGTLRLTNTVIAMRLKKYELVEQKATGTEVRHCYRLKDLGAAPGDGGVSEADLSGPLPAEYHRMLAMAGVSL